MQLYGCVVLCYANSVIRWHFSPVDLFQLPGDLTEIKQTGLHLEYSPIWSENKHELFSGLFLSKRITQTWRRGALPMPVSPVCSESFRPAAGGGPRTPAVSSAPHPRTRGRCGSPAGLHPLIPVTSMRLPLPVLTVMAVSRGNLPETVGPRRWVHCVLF